MITKIKNKNGEIFYYEEYDDYETIPEMVDKNKNNIQYLKAIAPEDLRPLILTNKSNITTNSNDIADTQIKVNTNTNDIDEIQNNKQDKEVWEDIGFTVKNSQNEIRTNEPSTLFSKIKITGEVILGSTNKCFLNQEFEFDKMSSIFFIPVGSSGMSRWIGELSVYKTTLGNNYFSLFIKGYKYVDASFLGVFTETSNLKIEGVRK